MRKLLFFALAILMFSAAGNATEIAGVNVPTQVTIASGKTLTLNGAGIRTKFFFKIYVGALYLAEPIQDAAAILQQRDAVSMRLHILYSEISKKKLVDAWGEGFENNLSETQQAALADRIKHFYNCFHTVHEGDTIALNYAPGVGTTLQENGEVQGVIPGEDFMHAWLRTWLGDHPADKSLKRELLAGN